MYRILFPAVVVHLLLAQDHVPPPKAVKVKVEETLEDIQKLSKARVEWNSTKEQAANLLVLYYQKQLAVRNLEDNLKAEVAKLNAKYATMGMEVDGETLTLRQKAPPAKPDAAPVKPSQPTLQ